MRSPLLFALALSLACRQVPSLDLFLALETEPGVETTGTVQLTNAGRELIVGEIEFRPDSTPAWWRGDGPWRIEPRGRREITVHFRPEASGTWDAELAVLTDAGTLTTQLELSAEVGLDSDGDGWSTVMGDCDDADAGAYPGAPEICNGIDEDCDGEIDEDFDRDGDGYDDASLCPDGTDCNDGDRSAFPGAEEVCDQTDSDCNGLVDDIDLLADLQAGICEGMTKACQPGGPIEPDYAAELPDYQVRETRCDTLDNDCDGVVDAFDLLGDGTSDCVDDDGDGEREVDGDCDDQDTEITSVDCGPTRLFVSSLDDGYLLIDLTSLETERVLLGGLLYEAAAGHQADEVLTTDRFSLVAQLDLAAGAVAGTLSLGVATWGIVRTESGYWVGTGTGDLVGLDTDATLRENVSVGTGAMSLTASEDGLWSCDSDGLLAHYDEGTEQLRTLAVEADCYGPPLVTPSTILVPGYGSESLAVVDRTHLDSAVALPLGAAIITGTLTDDGLWLAAGSSGLLHLDAETLENREPVAPGGFVIDVWWDARRRQLWAASHDTNEVLRLDAVTGEVLDRFPVELPIRLAPLP